MNRILRFMMIAGVMGSMTSACTEREAPLGQIDEAKALPIARPQWERAKLLALRLNTAEGPSVYIVGLGHSTAKLFGNSPDAEELEAICSVWAPIWAQIVWGPMTNRVYEPLKKFLPCGWYHSKSLLEFNANMVEELSEYKLGTEPAAK